MRILAVDCADKSVSCAVVQDGVILAENFLSSGFTHSKTLMPLILSMLEVAEIPIDSIDKFVITSGPGSFTGLRIGIAAVKGLAFKNNKKCVGVSTLHTIAMSGIENKGIICPVMDARCNQVYNALFRCDGEKLVRLCSDRALMCDELKSELDKFENEDIFIVGPGADMFCAKFEGQFKKPKARNVCQRAGDAAMIESEYEQVDSDKLLPVYLRLPQAERELKERKKQTCQKKL